MEGHEQLPRAHPVTDGETGRYRSLARGEGHRHPLLEAQPGGVLGVHQHIGPIGEGGQGAVAAAQGAGVILIEDAAGVEQERVFAVGPFALGAVGHWMQFGASAGSVEAVQKKGRRTGMVRVGTGPLDPLLRDSVEADAGHEGRYLGDLVEDLALICVDPHGTAHSVRQVPDDLPVLTGVTGRGDRSADPTDPAVAVDEATPLLGKGRSRENHVGQGRGFGGEDILDDEEIQLLQSLAGVVEIGVGEHGIFPHDIHPPHPAGVGGLNDLHRGQPHLVAEVRIGYVPDSGHLAAVGGVAHGNVAGIAHGQTAHVGNPLDVVLAPGGIDAGARLADLPGDETEIDQAVDQVGPRDLLTAAHAGGDESLSRSGKCARGSEQLPLGDPRDRFHRCRGIVGRHRRQRLQGRPPPFDATVDEVGIHPSFSNHQVNQPVEHGDVGPQTGLQPDVGILGKRGPAGIDDDQSTTLDQGLLDEGARHRMGLHHVVARHQNTIGRGVVFDAVGPGPRSQGVKHGRYRRGVAETGAIVDVVGAENGADKFLEEIVVLVGGLGAGVAGQGIATVGIAQGGEARRDEVQRGVPGSGLELAVALDQRLGETIAAGHEIVAETAFHAEAAVVGFDGRHPVGTNDAVLLDEERHLTAHPAVGAGGDDALVGRRRGESAAVRLFDNGAGGAELNALPAAVALRRPPLAGPGDDGGVQTAPVDAEDALALHLIAGLDAAEALDALGGIVGEHRRAVVQRGVDLVDHLGQPAPGGLLEAVAPHQFTEFVRIAQIGGLVVFGQKALEEVAPHPLQFVVEGGHHHTVDCRHRAGRHQAARAGDLDQTEAAGPSGREFRVVAEAGNIDAAVPGRPQEVGTGGRLNGPAIDGEPNSGGHGVASPGVAIGGASSSDRKWRSALSMAKMGDWPNGQREVAAMQRAWSRSASSATAR